MQFGENEKQHHINYLLHKGLEQNSVNWEGQDTSKHAPMHNH